MKTLLQSTQPRKKSASYTHLQTLPETGES